MWSGSVPQDTPRSEERARTKLEELFQVRGPGGAEPCTCDEIGRRLNSIFHRDIVRAIFFASRPSDDSQPNVPEGGTVLPQAWIDGFFQRKREVIAMIEKLVFDREDLVRLENEARVRLMEMKTADRDHLDEGKLTVQLLEARGPFRPGEVISVSAVCQQQRIATEPKPPQNVPGSGSALLWNELFAFQARDPSEYGQNADLSLYIVAGDPGRAEELARVTVELQRIKHQRREDLWLKDGEYSVHAVCQWVYSKVQLFRSHIQEYEQSIQQKEKELWRYQKELGSLRRPFNEEESVVTSHALRGVESLLSLMRISDTDRVMEIALGLFLIMACLSCFGRPDFLNLTLASMGIYCQLDGSWSAPRYRGVLVLMLCSFVLDVLWVSAYFVVWEGTTQLSNEHAISKAFSLLCWLPKAFLLLVFFKHYHQVGDNFEPHDSDD